MKTKIEVAIKDAKLKLKATQTELMILSRVREVQQGVVDSLETIDESKDLQ
jgi:hypothetical protein